jgi:hypothetical protein
MQIKDFPLFKQRLFLFDRKRRVKRLAIIIAVVGSCTYGLMCAGAKEVKPKVESYDFKTSMAEWVLEECPVNPENLTKGKVQRRYEMDVYGGQLFAYDRGEWGSELLFAVKMSATESR